MRKIIYVYKIKDIRDKIDKINSSRENDNLITWIPGIKVNDSWFMCPCGQKDSNPENYCYGKLSITMDSKEHEVIDISLISVHDKQRTYVAAYEKGSRKMAEILSLNFKPVPLTIVFKIV